MAETVPEAPAVDGAHQTERHHQHGDQEVGYRPGNHKTVGQGPEALETCSCSHDEKIPRNGKDGDWKEEAEHADFKAVLSNEAESPLSWVRMWLSNVFVPGTVMMQQKLTHQLLNINPRGSAS